PDVHVDVEVARRSALDPSLALAGQAQARPGLDAGGDLHGQRLLALDPTLAAARGTALAHDLAGAATCVARAADAEEALLEHQLAGAAAAAAALRLRARARPRSAAASARAQLGDRGPGVLAREHRGQLEGELSAQVRAAPAAPAAPPAPPARAEQVAEEIVQDVAERAEVAEVAEPGPAGASDPLVAEAVVGAALVRIGQHRVGLGGLLELLLGLRIVRIAVRMELERELAVGLLQRVGVGRAIDAQHLVVVALRQGTPRGGKVAASLGTRGRDATATARRRRGQRERRRNGRSGPARLRHEDAAVATERLEVERADAGHLDRVARAGSVAA